MSVTLTLWLMIAGIFVVLAVFVVVWGRSRFDCGCANDGRPFIACTVCGYSRCSRHRYDLHDCAKDAP